MIISQMSLIVVLGVLVAGACAQPEPAPTATATPDSTPPATPVASSSPAQTRAPTTTPPFTSIETPIATPTRAPATAPTPTQGPQIWQPKLNTNWQWQLTSLPIDQSLDVDMYDIDLFDNDEATVASLQAEGRKAICYMNAGGWENWRPDAECFASELIGGNLDDWEGEKWLDIRRIDLLGPIMEARMDMCRAKGFDGIEPDNVDGFLNDTGFPLTYEDQLRYNIWLAERAHERGLSIGLKNDMEQILDLLPYFDWALNEQCFEYDECETLSPFIDAGKAVFNVEYVLEPGDFCDRASALGFSSMRKNLDLDAWRDPCN